jgi:hypothetical protein
MLMKITDANSVLAVDPRGIVDLIGSIVGELAHHFVIHASVISVTFRFRFSGPILS